MPAQPAPQAAAEGRGASLLAGLVGAGIQLSRTPAMHEAEGAARSLNFIYQLFDTDRLGPNPPSLGEIIRSAEICGFAGLNVTYPYKAGAIEFLDELSDNAAAIGAVNTIIFRDGRRYGHNTDLWGFAESFRRNMPDAPRDTVLLIGAGGAGGAVAHALIECGTKKLLVADSDHTKAVALQRKLANRYGAGRAQAVGGIDSDITVRADGIVNATPVGMASLPGCPIPAELIRSGMWVADIIYFPAETELLCIARQKGCHTLAGDGMAVFQAVRAFELFTGIKPDIDRMKAAFTALDRMPADGSAGQKSPAASNRQNDQN